MKYAEQWPQFYTATISGWKPLLANTRYKDIIIKSLQFLILQKRIGLTGFAIMNNHIHLIWQTLHGHTLQNVQQSFMKFTAQRIKFDLIKTNPALLKNYRVNTFDREYRFWKRRPLGIELCNRNMLHQKLNYIHENPVKANFCTLPEEYYYSSVNFYQMGVDDFIMLTHSEG